MNLVRAAIFILIVNACANNPMEHWADFLHHQRPGRHTQLPNMEKYPQSVKHSLFDKQFVNQLNVCLQADHMLSLL